MHIYISRHGESHNNTLGIIGGDCSITLGGEKYAEFLRRFFYGVYPLKIYTSSLKRTKETVASFQVTKEFKELDEIFSGDFDDWIESDIKEKHPDIFEHRNIDKLNNSYPNGESYLDLQKRVLQVVCSINTDEHGYLLIVAHKAVCRVLYSYFTGKSLAECIEMDIKLHTLYKLENNNFIQYQAKL